MTDTPTEPKSTAPDVIARAASDPDFRARLLQDGMATLEMAADDLDQIAGGASAVEDILATLVKRVEDAANLAKDVAARGGKI